MADARNFLAPKGKLMVRDVLSNEKINGTVVNPPRYDEIGGLTGPSKGVKRNRYSIRKPGGTAA